MSTSDPLKSEIQFLDSSVPTLHAGTYQIDVTHAINEESYAIKEKYELKQNFIVQAPRFSLPPACVQGVYPTADSSTDFHLTLPYIVFNLEQLPWSRKIDDTGAAPWMALMIFNEGDLKGDETQARQQGPTFATIRDVKTEVVKYEDKKNGVFGPVIELDKIEKALLGQRTSTIDVPLSIFRELAPRLSELPFLAHIRKTGTNGLGSDEEAGTHAYSSLLANRLAKPGTEALYIAHVVSLEGWADFLPGGKPPAADVKTLRMVSLYSWKFNNKKEGANFTKLIDSMTVGALKMPFTIPAGWAKEDERTPAQRETVGMYNKGYVALNYETRTGERSFAWYRGPFMTVAPVSIKNLKPETDERTYATHISSADEAMIYDAENGIFDQSYAVAWELGRMLTLGNRPAAIAIWEWKKDSMKKLQVLKRIVADRLKHHKLMLPNENLSINALLDQMDWRQVQDDLMDNQAGKFIFMNYLGRKLGRHILGMNEEQEPVITMLDPTGLQRHLESMPGVLSTSEMLGALQQGIDPHMLISNKLDEDLRLHNSQNQQ